MKYLLRKCEMFALRTWANFISHQAKRDISQYAFAYYFTFCDSKTFHLYAHHPTIHLKGVTHYTLQDTACEKEYEQNCSYSFCYFFGRCCPLRVLLSGVRPRFYLRFARCCFAVRLRSASLRMTRADVVETRRANGNAVRISQGD